MLTRNRLASLTAGAALAIGTVIGIPAVASAAAPPPPPPTGSGKGTGGGGTLSDGYKSYQLSCSLYNGVQELRGSPQRICGPNEGNTNFRPGPG